MSLPFEEETQNTKKEVKITWEEFGHQNAELNSRLRLKQKEEVKNPTPTSTGIELHKSLKTYLKTLLPKTEPKPKVQKTRVKIQHTKPSSASGVVIDTSSFPMTSMPPNFSKQKKIKGFDARLFARR
jgi:hypothetical protein